MARENFAHIKVPFDAYNATTWNDNQEVPTKGDVRDIVNTVGGVTVTPNSSTPYSETATAGHKVVLHDASAGAITHNLPTAVGNGAILTIKKIDSSTNTITVDPNSTETIDGGGTAVLQVQYESISLVSDGTNWVII